MNTTQEHPKRQELFNKVWQHYVIEAKPLGISRWGGGCSYYIDNGEAEEPSRCGVGVLLGEHAKVFADCEETVNGVPVWIGERQSVGGFESNPEKDAIKAFRQLVSDFGLEGLQLLQEAHDGMVANSIGLSPEANEPRVVFTKLAKKLGVTVPQEDPK